MRAARQAHDVQMGDSSAMLAQGWRELDAYATLQVHPHAPRDLIAETYWLLITRAREHHAPEPYVRHLNNAYEVLCDDERRRRYDEELGVPPPQPESPPRRRGIINRQQRPTQENHYQLLRIDAAATREVIELAFKMLSRQCRHSNGVERLAWIEEAYATLSNPQRRAQYDEKLLPRRTASAPVPLPELPLRDTREEAAPDGDAEPPEKTPPPAPVAVEQNAHAVREPVDVARDRGATHEVSDGEEIRPPADETVVTPEPETSSAQPSAPAPAVERAGVAGDSGITRPVAQPEAGDEPHPSLLRRLLVRHQAADPAPSIEVAETRVAALAEGFPEPDVEDSEADESESAVAAPLAELVFTIGPLTGFRVPLTRESIVFGSEEHCDIVLTDQNGEVRARHARVGVMGEGFLLHQLDTFGVIRVNGEAIGRQLVILEPGDTVAIGSHAFTFQMPGEARAATRAFSA